MRVLTDGPGVVVCKRAFDPGVVDRATEVFEAMIAEQKAAGAVAGDHFAAPGANDRVWGALDKLAVRAPDVFADYYGNDVLALVCEAWLGSGYQLTSQVNVVNPGGQGPGGAQRLPPRLHVRRAGAPPTRPTSTGSSPVADPPGCGGPLRRCPWRPVRRCTCRTRSGTSPATSPGTCRRSSSTSTATTSQLPLETGDAAFFNPALFHGAGTNRTADVRRMANLLQVSSPFGRAMESVDRGAMVTALFPVLVARKAAGAPDAFLRHVVAASAEGYAFPTNLDRDQPVTGWWRRPRPTWSGGRCRRAGTSSA